MDNCYLQDTAQSQKNKSCLVTIFGVTKLNEVSEKNNYTLLEVTKSTIKSKGSLLK